MKLVRHYLSNEIGKTAKQREEDGMAYWGLKVQILLACMRIKNVLRI